MADSKQKQEKLTGNNLYIVLILISLLVVGAAVLITKNLIGSIGLNTKVISAQDVATKQLASDLQSAPQLVDAYQALGSQQQTLADALPIDADFPDLLVTLENMSNNSGLTIKSIAPSQGSSTTTAAPTAGPASGAQPYAFSMSFEGSFASVGRMLNQLETSARPMRVVGIQLSGTGSDLTGSLDVDTFYQPAAQMPFSTESIH